jgi:hypothetical protein
VRLAGRRRANLALSQARPVLHHGGKLMAQMPDIEGGLGPVEGFAHRVEHDAAGFMRHLMHHGAPAQDPDAATQTPAVQPVNLATEVAMPPKENTVQISNIAGDIKGAIENADEWVKQVTETHLPSLLAQAARYEQSPIVQALESALLPPEVESGIAAMIKDLAARYPAPVVAAPDAPAAPVTA